MPFKPKPVVKAGKGDWEVLIPRPPRHATHACMMAIDQFSSDHTPKRVMLPIQDFGCFKGVSGDFSYIRMNKQRKVLEEYKGTWTWDGSNVVGIEDLTSG